MAGPTYRCAAHCSVQCATVSEQFLGGNDGIVIDETENVVLVRQEDMACRYAIGLSNLCWLHKLIVTHRAPSSPRVFGFQRTHSQNRAGLSGSVAILGTAVPTVLSTVPKLTS